MNARATIANVQVEIDDREAARIAEAVIRARYDLADATCIHAGRLIAYRRDDRGKPEAHTLRGAVAADADALRVIQTVRASIVR